MSFGQRLYSKFKDEAPKLCRGVTEQILFEALERAFKNLSSCNPVECSVIHGTKYLVAFDEIKGIPFYYDKDLCKKVMCELADLLIIVVNRKEMRVCCLQNKYEKAWGRVWEGFSCTREGFSCTRNSFHADMRQFYLLKKRPVFEIAGNKSTLLNKAICPSVGSYGVFYYKKDSGYNMVYVSAEVLKTSRKSCGRRRRVSLKEGSKKIVGDINSSEQKVTEQRYSEDMVEFGDGLVKMQIGTPFTINKGLSVLGDKKIFDAVVEMTGKKDEELKNIEKSIETGGARVYYRSAVVIKSEFEGNNYEFIDIKNIID